MQKSYKGTVLTLVNCNKEFKPQTFAASPFFVNIDEEDIILNYIQDTAYSFKSPLKGEHYISLIVYSKGQYYYPSLLRYISKQEVCKKIIDIKFIIDQTLVKENRIIQQFEWGQISFHFRRLKENDSNKEYYFVSHPNIIISKDFLEEKI